MDVKALAALARFSPDALQQVGVYQSQNLQVTLLCLEPGQVEESRTHDDADKVYFVLDGEGTARVGSEQRKVRSEDAVLAPPGVPHGLTNDGNTRLTALVVVAPNPST